LHLRLHDRLCVLPLLAVLLAAGCAAPGGAGPRGGPARTADIDQGALVLAGARKTRDEKGCAAAAPALRVAAAMGEGKEAAQHELGECLMTMAGATETETRLFREEGRFWLTRAAYAGNARAQRFLAVEGGRASAPHATQADALGWALVYQKNSEADLFGYKALPATFVPGLIAALPPAEVARAERFAADFRPLPLTAFEPPKIDRPDGPGGALRLAPRGGGQRR